MDCCSFKPSGWVSYAGGQTRTVDLRNYFSVSVLKHAVVKHACKRVLRGRLYAYAFAYIVFVCMLVFFGANKWLLPVSLKIIFIRGKKGRFPIADSYWLV